MSGARVSSKMGGASLKKLHRIEVVDFKTKNLLNNLQTEPHKPYTREEINFLTITLDQETETVFRFEQASPDDYIRHPWIGSFHHVQLILFCPHTEEDLEKQLNQIRTSFNWVVDEPLDPKKPISFEELHAMNKVFPQVVFIKGSALDSTKTAAAIKSCCGSFQMIETELMQTPTPASVAHVDARIKLRNELLVILKTFLKEKPSRDNLSLFSRRGVETKETAREERKEFKIR